MMLRASTQRPDTPALPILRPNMVRILRKNISSEPPRSGLLTGMRIRKKLIVLHTVFSAILAVILIIAIRPAIQRVVRLAEVDESKLLLSALAPAMDEAVLARLPGAQPDNLRISRGSASDLGLTSEAAAAAQLRPLTAIEGATRDFDYCALMFVPGDLLRPAGFVALKLVIPDARDAVFHFYVIGILVLLAMYVLVALALEVIVLPQNVYGPIRLMRDADEAARAGNRARELIPEHRIPADELGDIMRSRNDVITGLREQEAALGLALRKLADAASDLQKKNHLLQAAQRNLADADRLASLGMMSAGIAHELNTPLAVVKGLAEKLEQSAGEGAGPCSLARQEAALLLRVVRRLERLGDSLLDFARLRPANKSPAVLHGLVAEAILLVRLDRERAAVTYENQVEESVIIDCDSDRMVQVLVNLLRNAADAATSAEAAFAGEFRVVIRADVVERPGGPWVSITVSDNGPGINANILPRLFEPFASTRLDSKGTGLGLAVAHGIIREHGGMISARNGSGPDLAAAVGESAGAVFEIMIPARAVAADPNGPSSVPEGVEATDTRSMPDLAFGHAPSNPVPDSRPAAKEPI